MLSWERYWPESMYQDIEEIRIGGRPVRVYGQMKQNLYQAFCESVKRWPDKTAIIDDYGIRYTYQELQTRTERLARTFTTRYSIPRGGHVGLLLYNGIEFCISYLALSKIGAVAVALPGKFKKPELLPLIKKSDTRHLICQEKFAPWFAGEEGLDLIVSKDNSSCGLDWAMTEPSGCAGSETGMTGSPGVWADDAVFMFTSGTTSKSKAVVMKNYHIMNSVESYIRTLKLTTDDVTLIATPMYHVTGMICNLSVFLAAGGTVHIMKTVDPGRILPRFIDAGVTFYHASPTVFAMLLERVADYPEIPSMRGFACGSGNMPPENIRRLKAWMPEAAFHTVYGLTETTGAGTIFPDGAADSPWIGASGVPMPHLQVKIIDDLDDEITVGTVGEVCLRGGFVLESYYQLESEAITPDGWLKTGDLGYVNEAGYLYIVDRKKDMINRGGEKICSFDIENEICALPGVAEAAVIGVPHHKYMEVPLAVVKAETGTTLTSELIRDRLKDRIARYKIPEHIIFADEIPKNHNGKVDKNRLKQQLKEEGNIWEKEH